MRGDFTTCIVTMSTAGPGLLQLLYLSALSVGVVTDVRSRRVPNVLVLAIALIGCAGALFGWSVAHSIGNALLGGAVGLSVWFPLWILGMLGAGDVKYFAAAAVWLGASLAWKAALLAAIVGGVMSLVVLLYQRGFRQTLNNLVLQARHAELILADANVGDIDAKLRTFPYALPMALSLATAALRVFPATQRISSLCSFHASNA